jgi:hypothetical protein
LCPALFLPVFIILLDEILSLGDESFQFLEGSGRQGLVFPVEFFLLRAASPFAMGTAVDGNDFHIFFPLSEVP